MVDKQIIDQTAMQLLAAAPPRSEVILFGSHARGNAGHDSDLDFLVIEPIVTDKFGETVRLRQSLKALRVGIDILVTSRRTFEDWKDTPNNVLHEAWKEGRVYR